MIKMPEHEFNFGVIYGTITDVNLKPVKVFIKPPSDVEIRMPSPVEYFIYSRKKGLHTFTIMAEGYDPIDLPVTIPDTETCTRHDLTLDLKKSLPSL